MEKLNLVDIGLVFCYFIVPLNSHDDDDENSSNYHKFCDLISTKIDLI